MNEKKTVKVFTTPVCPYCYTLKEFLKAKGIKFQDIDISKDEKAREELIQKTGKMEVPILEIEGELVIGFDKTKIVNLLGIKK